MHAHQKDKLLQAFYTATLYGCHSQVCYIEGSQTATQPEGAGRGSRGQGSTPMTRTQSAAALLAENFSPRGGKASESGSIFLHKNPLFIPIKSGKQTKKQNRASVLPQAHGHHHTYNAHQIRSIQLKAHSTQCPTPTCMALSSAHSNHSHSFKPSMSALSCTARTTAAWKYHTRQPNNRMPAQAE